MQLPSFIGNLSSKNGLHRLGVTSLTAYFMEFTSIKVSNGNKVFELGTSEMSAQDYSMAYRPWEGRLSMESSVINDSGEPTLPFKSKVNF